ncbi:hypothetical protein NPIL_664761 [Nephila pilipes]|uniref:Uncharacterized protein n=1 Tax=Nephila pilipes TaxID=299642 RepID=A0A8X6PVT8_NEPPI|nr:hypothetical protein NPIL_664761 [Nephila pilipes]
MGTTSAPKKQIPHRGWCSLPPDGSEHHPCYCIHQFLPSAVYMRSKSYHKSFWISSKNPLKRRHYQEHASFHSAFSLVSGVLAASPEHLFSLLYTTPRN